MLFGGLPEPHLYLVVKKEVLPGLKHGALALVQAQGLVRSHRWGPIEPHLSKTSFVLSFRIALKVLSTSVRKETQVRNAAQKQPPTIYITLKPCGGGPHGCTKCCKLACGFCFPRNPLAKHCIAL